MVSKSPASTTTVLRRLELKSIEGRLELGKASEHGRAASLYSRAVSLARSELKITPNGSNMKFHETKLAQNWQKSSEVFGRVKFGWGELKTVTDTLQVHKVH